MSSRTLTARPSKRIVAQYPPGSASSKGDVVQSSVGHQGVLPSIRDVVQYPVGRLEAVLLWSGFAISPKALLRPSRPPLYLKYCQMNVVNRRLPADYQVRVMMLRVIWIMSSNLGDVFSKLVHNIIILFPACISHSSIPKGGETLLSLKT